jgi:hypothetical protein
VRDWHWAKERIEPWEISGGEYRVARRQWRERAPRQHASPLQNHLDQPTPTLGNPQPGYVSKMTKSAPFLIAITSEPVEDSSTAAPSKPRFASALLIEKRDPKATPHQIDLTTFYNRPTHRELLRSAGVT